MKKIKFTTVMTTSVAAILLSAAMNPALAQAATVGAQDAQQIVSALESSQANAATTETATSSVTNPAPATNQDQINSEANSELTSQQTDSTTTTADNSAVDQTEAATPESVVPTAPVVPAAQPAMPTITASEVAPIPATTLDKEQPAPTTGEFKLPLASRAEQDINLWMPNKTLQKIVLYWLNQNSEQAGKTWTDVSQITQNDLQYLTKISNYSGLPTTGEYRALRNTYIDGETSYSLAGLEFATNLTYLNLRSADLNTAETEAIRGDITDISQLAGLQKLTYIELTGNRITDVTPISQLPAVTEMHVGYNSIADLSSLDPSRYETLMYNDQFIVLPVAYVSPSVDRYEMPMDQIKLPGGKIATPALTAGAGSAVRILFDASRYFYKGAEGSDEDGKIVYSKFREQRTPGFTELPNLPTKVIQNPYYFYMSSIAGENKGDTTFQVFQPYLLQDDLAHVMVHSSTIWAGDTWEPADNFEEAFDHDGKLVSFDKVKVTGTVDTTKPGVYPITYEYDGHQETIQVTVEESEATLVVKDQTVTVGDQWDPISVIESATENDGTEIAPDKIKITGDYDLNTPGVYELTYASEFQTTTMKLTVLPKKNSGDQSGGSGDEGEGTGDNNQGGQDDQGNHGGTDNQGQGSTDNNHHNDNQQNGGNQQTGNQSTAKQPSKNNQGATGSQTEKNKQKHIVVTHKQTNNEPTLPKTGEANRSLNTLLLGVGLLLIGGLSLLVNRRRH
ncbi:bacterial Ig-like domain-containing protein [Lapidilactobacillus wuchangensis]|uniref:bacterial Ig-like domain-containing protein n=1 Tax=Lapidilactobacillus wuchangensis TaxID=2486001 RepID=UPI000F7809FB|nr:bacterial Ig-like domain-containing protein [Lapidilactobacillus wuchangensis]